MWSSHTLFCGLQNKRRRQEQEQKELRAFPRLYESFLRDENLFFCGCFKNWYYNFTNLIIQKDLFITF